MAAVGGEVSRNNQIFHQSTENNFPRIPHASLRNSFGITCKWLPFLFHTPTVPWQDSRITTTQEFRESAEWRRNVADSKKKRQRKKERKKERKNSISFDQ